MASETHTDVDDGRCLLVRAGAERFAIPAAAVAGVVRDLVVHPIPGGRPPLLGLGQHGGEPMVVVDLLELVTGAVGGQQITVLVSSRTGASRPDTVGLAVDDAERMVTVTGLTTAEAERGVRGFGRVDGETVRVVDPDRLAEARPEAQSDGASRREARGGAGGGASDEGS